MGRRKTHSREELLLKAMQVFREKGYAGTSADLLVERIGVSRYSLYSDFGSKQGLFEAALQRYNDDVISLRFGPLEQPDASLQHILDLLAFYGEAADGPAAGLGCLLCNTAVEFGADDPSGDKFVERYFERLSGAFANALKNARKAGQLMPNVDVSQEADFLTSVVVGLFVLIRAKAPIPVIRHAAKAAQIHCETLAA
ncbi:TetR/AcrR family transcriptional regulator [Roseibium sediminis]|uniref:TetR/AcrR family transcriptional regulator n=1 Tax=Roseibium sediminis TaxID=1775174 RepID=UPI00123D5C4C|nr:TetR/AcrR family transcriptional regulator [Roseibium sediminis]